MPQPTSLVRRAGIEESAVIAALHRAVFAACLPYLPKLHTPQEDCTFFREHVFKVCEVWAADAGTVVGYIAFREGWVDHLYVAPEHHGRGIGSALLAKAMKVHARLALWTFQKNTQARAFYERKGFTLDEFNAFAFHVEDAALEHLGVLVDGETP